MRPIPQSFTDRCSHGGETATFHIEEYIKYEKLGEYGDDKAEEYHVRLSEAGAGGGSPAGVGRRNEHVFIPELDPKYNSPNIKPPGLYIWAPNQEPRGALYLGGAL